MGVWFQADIASPMVFISRFWLSWRRGDIQLGSGDLFNHVMLSWDFREPDSNIPSPFSLTYLTVASAGLVVEWEFNEQNRKGEIRVL